MGFSLSPMLSASFSFKRPFSTFLAIDALFLTLLHISFLFSHFPSYSSRIWEEELGKYMGTSPHFLPYDFNLFLPEASTTIPIVLPLFQPLWSPHCSLNIPNTDLP